MKEPFEAPGRRINSLQILIGVSALLCGSLIYLIDRPPEHTYFVYSSPITISLFTTIPHIFGGIGGSLPAFIHVFSFIVITAGLIFCQRKGYLIICLSWFLIDAAFEVGQKFTTWSISIIPDWFAGIPLLENTENYFLKGTFDFLDLAAIAFGTVIACFVLLITNKRKRREIA
jgi:ABC-type xylose transport system permease subunit